MLIMSIKQVESWFEDDNWIELGVSKTSVIRNLKSLIPWPVIVESRFFPQFTQEDILDRVHLLFISRSIVHHVYIGRRKVVFSEYPIANVSIKLEFSYSPNRKEDMLTLYFDVGELREDGRPWMHYFIAPAKLRGHAVSLVSIINSLKEAVISSEDTEN